MEHDFWHNKWESNQIGFHNDAINPLLTRHVNLLKTRPEARVFVPLCGKSLDMAWLRDNKLQVVGAELSEIAVVQFFEELGEQPSVTLLDNHKLYSIPGIDIYQGDFFTLDTIGPVDSVYDRAAFVAMPSEMREQYAEQVARLSNQAPQLLITLAYDQSLVQGPPFSIDESEVNNRYSNTFTVSLIDTDGMAMALKGKYPVTESAWHLTCADQ